MRDTIFAANWQPTTFFTYKSISTYSEMIIYFLVRTVFWMDEKLTTHLCSVQVSPARYASTIAWFNLMHGLSQMQKVFIFNAKKREQLYISAKYKWEPLALGLWTCKNRCRVPRKCLGWVCYTSWVKPKSLENSKSAFVCCSDELRGWVCNNSPKSKNCVSTSPYSSSDSTMGSNVYNSTGELCIPKDERRVLLTLRL